MAKWIKILIFIIIILFLQISIFTGINFFRFASPFIYPLILVILPIELSQIKSTIISFILGALIDLLTHVPGIHAASFTLIGFMRPFLLSMLVDQDINKSEAPTWNTLGFRSLIFLFEIIVINTTFLFIIDSMKIFDLLSFLIRLGFSIAISIIISIIILFIFDISFDVERR